MELHEIRRAIQTETDEAKLTELIILRDKLLAEEKAAEPLNSDEAYARMLDYTHN